LIYLKRLRSSGQDLDDIKAARGLAMRKVDMSSPAVTLRLKRVSQLRHLCLSLGKAKQGDPKRPDSLQNCRQMNLKQGTHDKAQ
jgi:hypothetical protein